MDIVTINDNLGLPNPSNIPFEVNDDKANLKWVEKNLVPKGWEKRYGIKILGGPTLPIIVWMLRGG